MIRPNQPGPGVQLNAQQNSIPMQKRPVNFAEYMGELQKPLQFGNVGQNAQDISNRLKPYHNYSAIDLKKALPDQITSFFDTDQKNVDLVKKSKQAIANHANQAIQWQKAMQQENLAEQALYTKEATEQLMRSTDRIQDIRNHKIDPSRYFKDMSTWQRIVGMIGVATAGIMHGRAGYDPNEVVVGLANLIEQDIDAQEKELDSKKWEHQQISLNDKQKLMELSKSINARRNARSNMAALVTSELNEMRKNEEDKRKIAMTDNMTRALNKYIIKKNADSFFQQKEIDMQRSRQEQFDYQLYNYKQKTQAIVKEGGQEAYHNTTPIAPGQEEHNLMMAYVNAPETANSVVKPDKQQYSQEEHELARMKARPIRLARAIKAEVNPYKKRELAKSLPSFFQGDEQTQLTITFAKNAVNTIEGQTVYLSPTSNVKEIKSVVDLNREFMTDGARALMALNGLRKLKGGAKTDFSERMQKMVDQESIHASIRREYGDVESFRKLSKSEQRKFIDKSAAKKYNDTEVASLLDQIQTATNIHFTEEQIKENPAALAERQVEVYLRAMVAKAIYAMTGDKSGRVSDRDLALTYLGALGISQIKGTTLFKYNLGQHATRIDAGLEALLAKGITHENNLLSQNVANYSGIGVQKMAATYDLGNPKYYKNQKSINILNQLIKNHNLARRPSSIERLNDEIEKYLDEQKVFVTENEEYFKYQRDNWDPTKEQ